MNTEDTTQPGAEAPVVTPATETEAPVPATETAETTTQPVEGEPGKTAEPEKAKEGEPEQPKPKSRAQQRIEDLSAAKRAAEDRERAALARIKVLEAAQKPNPDAYDDPTAFQSDVTKAAIREARVEELKQEAEEHRREADTARKEAWQEKVASVADRFPDFDAVVHQNPNLATTEAMVEVITTHENGPAIAYFLGKNPQEAQRIARLPVALQGLELGRIEAKISVLPPKKVSTAPAPIPALTGGGGVTSQKSAEDMTYEEYRASRGYS